MSAMLDTETDQIHKWNRILQYNIYREKKQFDLLIQVYKSFFFFKTSRRGQYTEFSFKKIVVKLAVQNFALLINPCCLNDPMGLPEINFAGRILSHNFVATWNGIWLTANVIHPCVSTMQDTCADALVSEENGYYGVLNPMRRWDHFRLVCIKYFRENKTYNIAVQQCVAVQYIWWQVKYAWTNFWGGCGGQDPDKRFKTCWAIKQD